MAYYISFMKTLSLKLNKYTIHFFFNEVTNILLALQLANHFIS